MKPKAKTKENSIKTPKQLAAGLTSIRRQGKNVYLLIPAPFVEYLDIGKKENIYLVPTNGVVQICASVPRLTIPLFSETNHSFEPLPAS